MIADGADVVFGMGDGSSFGMLQAVEGADGVKFIDVIGDKTTIDKQGVLLSSVLWNFDVLFKQTRSTTSAPARSARRTTSSTSRTRASRCSRPTRSTTRPGASGEGTKQEIIDGDIKVPVTDEEVAGGGPDLAGLIGHRRGRAGAPRAPARPQV